MMASSFDRWEKDPFFSAAEEVQESADRMESIYRTWKHAMKNSSLGMWNSGELKRDLRTALGTTKWQLEELEKAVGSSYVNSSTDDARDRHGDFISVIGNQISVIETSLKESAVSEGKPPLPWVRLDEGERNELALFLSGPSQSLENGSIKNNGRHEDITLSKDSYRESATECSRNSSSELDLLDSKNGKMTHGCRRTASAADMGTWEISIAGEFSIKSTSNGHHGLPPRRIPSLYGFLSTMGSTSKLKWPKNGFIKLKSVDHQEADTTLLQDPQLTKGMNACYEKTKSCIDSCDDCYDKRLYGWYGSIQRRLQRSQYYMQYSRPVRIIFWVALLLCFIVLIALCAAT